MSKSVASIKDVAARAGVSKATVSNVFSGKKPVKHALAAKVRKAASDLGYHGNRAASMLRSGQNKIVAIVVPDLADPFFASVIREIERLAKQDGFEIIVANSDNDAENEISRLDALLSCLAERKIEIGAEISVVGFDDFPWMVARRTAITAIRQPVPEIALSIWQRLKSRMEGDQSPPHAIELECSLKIRDSANPIHQKPMARTSQSDHSDNMTSNSGVTSRLVRKRCGRPVHFRPFAISRLLICSPRLVIWKVTTNGATFVRGATGQHNQVGSS